MIHLTFPIPSCHWSLQKKVTHECYQPLHQQDLIVKDDHTRLCACSMQTEQTGGRTVTCSLSQHLVQEMYMGCTSKASHWMGHWMITGMRAAAGLPASVPRWVSSLYIPWRFSVPLLVSWESKGQVVHELLREVVGASWVPNTCSSSRHDTGGPLEQGQLKPHTPCTPAALACQHSQATGA